MAKAPEKKVEPAPKAKVNHDIKGLAAHAANMIAVHQFHQAVHSTANPALAKELTRVNDELIEALNDE